LTDPFVERRRGERRQDERDRQRLFEQLVAAEQDERRRIALFLHDGPVQSLSGIALMLDAVGHAIEDGRLDEAREVLASSLVRHRLVIQTLRDLSFNLEPVVLRDRGFVAAVEALADRLGLAEEVQIDIDVAAAETLGEKAQAALYQIIREALSQAVQRSPSKIAIHVVAAGGIVETTVADNGHLERRARNVEAIEERAKPLSGRVAVARSEAGTTVRVTLPEYAAAQ
jgi:two-component system, NarL family, sensor histidine kinase UhpB